jgi:hypothetical protein
MIYPPGLLFFSIPARKTVLIYIESVRVNCENLLNWHPEKDLSYPERIPEDLRFIVFSSQFFKPVILHLDLSIFIFLLNFHLSALIFYPHIQNRLKSLLSSYYLFLFFVLKNSCIMPLKRRKDDFFHSDHIIN